MNKQSRTDSAHYMITQTYDEYARNFISSDDESVLYFALYDILILS